MRSKEKLAEIFKEFLIELVGEERFQKEAQHLELTPERVARAYLELTEGYEQDKATILKTDFCESSELVLVKDIPFSSLCAHHLLPFSGMAHVAYIPGDRIVGLSKLARIVDMYAKRLQVQERITEQVASAIMDKINPQGVMVVLEAKHLCMSIRGVKKETAVTVTSAVRGKFTNMDTRSEALSLIKG